MSAHFVRRHKLSVTAHSWLPRSPSQTSTSTLRIMHAQTANSRPVQNLTTGESLFEFVVLLGAMFLLFILLLWLAMILLGHAYRFVRDKLDIGRRGRRDIEWAGAETGRGAVWTGHETERGAKSIGRETERAAKSVRKGTDRAARKVGDLGEEGAREFGRFNSWLVHKTESTMDKAGERSDLLSKDGADDGETSGRTLDCCKNDCGSGTRRRSGVGCE